jgi:hypothetical protein
MIVGWLANRAEQIAFIANHESEAWQSVREVCRRARTVAGFVRLWMMPAMRGAALQLVGAERQHWPLPSGDVDPGELMEGILEWIDRQDEIVADSLARRAA